MSQQMPERIPGGGIDLSHLAARGQQAAASNANAAGGAAAPGAPGGAGPVVDVPALVINITDSSFEQAAQLSTVVPVVVNLWSDRAPSSESFGQVLSKVTEELAGQLMLGMVDVDANPGLAQAFQMQSVPMVVALVGGRPVPLFQGAVPEEQVREMFGQLLQLAQQQGVAGRVNAPNAGGDAAADGADDAPTEPQIPEAHLAAVEAAERGDYEAAVAEWEAVLAKAPADQAARAALVQMRLLQRLQGVTVDGVRSAAAAQPQDIDAQMSVADLDVSGGHIEDAFLRLLELFTASDDAGRTRIRERMLELFEVVGVTDPRVVAARGRLANLLY